MNTKIPHFHLFNPMTRLNLFSLQKNLNSLIILFLFISSFSFLCFSTQAQSKTPSQSSSSESSSPQTSDKKESHPKKKKNRRQYHPETVQFGNDIVIRSDETKSNVFNFFGNVVIKGKVLSEVVVIGGNLTLSPTAVIERDVVVIEGNIQADPGSQINGDLFLAGGKLSKDPDHSLVGRQTVIVSDVPVLGKVWDWFSHGLILGRPIAHQFRWVWFIAICLYLINVLLQIIFPKPIEASMERLEKKPFMSFFIGLLILLLTLPLIVVLGFLIIGALLIPFLLCALAVIFVIGRIAIYRHTGSRLAKQLGISFLDHPFISLTVGTFIFYLFYTIPVLGLMLWGFITPFGLGAVFLAMTDSLKKENTLPPSSSNTPPSASPPSFASTASASAPSLGPELLDPIFRAGFWRRFAAMTIDFIIVAVLLNLLLGRHLEPPVFFLFWILYHIVFWSWKETTVGGLVMKIKLVQLNGKPMTPGVSTVRSLSCILSAIPLGIGFFWVGWDRARQSWHDKITDTCIIKTPSNPNI